MNKKLSLIFLTSLLLVGCGSSGETHAHTYSTEWSFNATHHWHDATCGHSVRSDIGTHIFTNWVIDFDATETSDGQKHRGCETCTYEEYATIPATGGGGEHIHTFATTWSYDSEKHWHAATCGHFIMQDVATHTFGNWVVDTEPTETTDGHSHRNCTVCPYVEEKTIPATGGGGEEEDPETPSEIDSIQDMNILHAWDWKLNDIKTRLKKIKRAGYGAIQISPMQPHVDTANGAKGSTSGNWWKLYQPLGFQVATGTQNILGTKDDLISLCSSANSEGLKIVVDVVTNHLAGTNNSYSNQVYKRYPLHDAGEFNDDSIKAVVQGHIGLPDLDTSDSEVQSDVLAMLKEYIDCGVSGFRFDAAKHIETPDDGEYASNFWPYVLDGTTNYAISKGYEKPYYYGEILGTCGTGRSFSSYTKYMSVVDSTHSGDTLEASIYETPALLPSTFNTKQTADKLVLWAESHDNYANVKDTTRYHDTSVINKAYAIQASRRDAATLYYARPTNMDVSMCTIDDAGGWQQPVVRAINKFHDRYVDKNENWCTTKNCFINVRGTGNYAGAAVVNLTDNESKSVTINDIKDGKYVDMISAKEFIIYNHQATLDFTDGVCVLIPKDAYVPEEEDVSYVSSLVIEDAPTTYTYIAWVWGNGSSGAWRAFNKDQKAIGLSLSSGESFTIVEFASGTTTSSANWNNAIRQTVDMSYSGNQQIIAFNSLSWKTSS